LSMNLLVVILLTGLVSAMPKKGNIPNQARQDKEDPSTIIRCMAENWQNGEPQIQACRDCFKAVDKTDEGLTKAKECTAEFLELENKACATQISALKSFEDKEKVMEVLKCFEETLERANAKQCLEESHQSTNVTEKLTDSSMCVLASWKYGMAYVKNATMNKGGRGKGKRLRAGRRGKGKGGKKMKIMKLITKAHCSLASEEDEMKTSDCLGCFGAAVKLGLEGKRKGGKGKKAMSPKMLSAMTDCSEKHLIPKYQKCTNMMKDAGSNKKETHECFLRVLVNNMVVECTETEDIAVATPETLVTVMDCGKDNAIDWAKENASAEMAEQIGNFLDDDDDDSDEDIEG